MKTFQTLTLLFMAIQLITARPLATTDYRAGITHLKPKPVATVVKGKVKINYKALSKKTAGGKKVTGYRMLFSKDKKFIFLVQEYIAKKGKANRYIPLTQQGSVFVVDMEPDGDWIDCWLMTCSTCEEVISGSGGVWCECSAGGCESADTSEPWQSVAEKLFQ